MLCCVVGQWSVSIFLRHNKQYSHDVPWSANSQIEMFSEKSLKLFIADVLTQNGWQSVSYTRACSSKACCQNCCLFMGWWDDTCPDRSWSEQTMTTVGDEVDVIRQVHRCHCQARQWLVNKTCDLVFDSSSNRNQCSWCSTGIIWSHRQALVMRHVVTYWTDCTFWIRLSDALLYSNELQ